MTDAQPKTDRKGYLTVRKGDTKTTAKIVPSSLHVWEQQGWKLDVPTEEHADDNPEPASLAENKNEEN